MNGKNAISTCFWWFIGVGLLATVAVVVASQAVQDAPPSAGPAAEAPIPARFPVYIRQPAGPPVVQTGELDERGRPIVANCTTCHTTKPANVRLNDGDDLKDFHQGLTTHHGQRTCLSCHNPQDYSQLRLADGQPVAFQQVMTLCAQCHGPQFKDYQHGAHGGMNGYWDLTRGPRTRNNCIDCHDPHAPQYPKLMPVLRPNDRFLRSESSENAHE